ncbi:MAG: hypothetical protein WBC05_07490 [Sedimentisphaerales bacterium]
MRYTMDPNSVSAITEATYWGIWLQFMQTIAICLASGVAIYGVESWRREFTGKRRIELAEDVLVLFYEAKDAIKFIRSPLGFIGEGSTRERGEDETPEQTRARNLAYVAIERYEKKREIFGKLGSLRYRFWAQIGRDKAEPFNEIKNVMDDIFGASRRLARRWERRSQISRPTELEALSEEIRRYEAIFWFGEEDDKIGERVEKAVSQMEDTCSNIIMRKSPHKKAKAMGKGNKENLK